MNKLNLTKNCKLLAIFLSVLLVGGCSKVFNQVMLAQADAFCEPRGGIYNLTVNDANSVTFYAYCKNGERKTLKSN